VNRDAELSRIFDPSKPLHDEQKVMPAFERLTPEDMRLCIALGSRAAEIVSAWAREKRRTDVEVSAMILAMDFATVHLVRPLKLYQLLITDDLSFTAEFVAVQRGIIRPLASFDNAITLAFAASPF